MSIASPSEFRLRAKRRLPRFLFDYLDGGSFAESTIVRNSADLDAIELRQRVLAGVADTDLSVTLFGRTQSLPVILGPVGIAGMYWRRGEVAAAEAAERRGVPFCLSTVGLCGVGEVASASSVPIWFQLYVMRDRGVMRELLLHARASGCRVLVFTVDMPLPGVRYRDARSGMSGPGAAGRRILQAASRPAWAWSVGVRGRPHRLGNLAKMIGSASGLNDYMGWLGANFDPGIGWSDLEWIRSAWDGPLVIKGILDPDDAKAAASIGADGIVVSNHGGRQLDGVPSTVRALPAIVEALGDRLPVLVDGGVRTGLDVIRMLSLGAEGVMLGRAWVYALAAAGPEGVEQLLGFIEREMRVALALTGVPSVRSLGIGNLTRPPDRA